MSPRPNDAARRSAWLLAVSLVLLLGGASVWAAGQAEGPAAGEKPPQPAKESIVKLTVDYGDGVEKRFKALEWKPGLTALEALELAGRHKRGVKVQHRGAGPTAFVEAIDDLENEGGGGRNWLYQINGEKAKRGAGVSPLEAGDEVLWTFGSMR